MILTKEILQQKKSAKEYFGWVEDLVAKVHATNGGTEQIRLRIGLAKQLMEEMLPIGRFSQKHFNSSKDVHIELCLGNQHFDATVHHNENSEDLVNYIEVTTTNIVGASNGYENYLYKHHLHRHESSGTGVISAKGNKFKGLETTLQRDMVSQEDVLKHERETIREAIERKANIKYPNNTALVISFDDLFAFDHQENIDNVMNVLKENKEKLAGFKLVAVVGKLKDLYLEYRIE